MATIFPPPISPLQSPTPFPRASPSGLFPHAPPKFSTRATDSDSDSSSQPDPPPEAEADDDDDFEARLNRLRYRSGTGKKAELRKTRKSKSTPGGGSTPSGGMFLPAVPLKEAASSLGGAAVEFGFSPYSERVNGVVAALGLAGLVSVELATGKSLLNFHTPSIVLVQLYFVAAVATIFVKYEKERISVWPNDYDDDNGDRSKTTG